ncbi:hypothetical protein N7509_009780 [Penicillium cosmopolitanum]|uniref:aldehyde dehydrogenase (NAD(+)) n=1 Tax=Penicillium cosmopolitanum TaxID=1131564 RepID=A0A9W9VQA8_9EURO|nr:uncharacterized protein N7509_009780 [Penicillium cosmopolitanum]KAJ5387239.1 hypothetical protein N7509_009780 [Penicillium cosmopolitanum]
MNALTNILETRLFINGEYVDSMSNQRLSCYNAIDHSLVTNDVHAATKEDVDIAVAAAQAAFTGWSSTLPQIRAKILNKFSDLLEEHSEQLSLLEHVCSGQPMLAMKSVFIPAAATRIRYSAGWSDKLAGQSFPAENGFLKIVHREPLGVCAAITAFNAPLMFMAAKVGPCLAVGNVIILKPSEKTPLSTLYLGRLAKEAGFPPGVFNIIGGAGATGAFLAEHLEIDRISFTGSLATGKKVAQAASKSNLKRVGLELGGKSPSIIFADADLDNAVHWCTRGIVTASGQMCNASSRVYVHEDIKEKFIQRMKSAFEGIDISQTQAPVIDRIQLARVERYIDQGTKESSLLTGGTRMENSSWIRPTIFVDPSPDATIYKEEIFGPVVVISGFTDEQTVVEKANNSKYGLHSAVFTQDINRAMRLSSKVSSGTVCINCTLMVDVGLPFGGCRQSGWGREGGKIGMEEWTEPKTIFVNLTY